MKCFKNGSVSFWGLKNKNMYLTTMMAILPPTSPTTVMGGFSLAIITGKEEGKRWED